MKRYILLLFPLLLFSCAGLRKMPVENKQVVINPRETEELLITETYSYEEEITASVEESKAAQQTTEVQHHAFSIDEPVKPVKDTIRYSSSQTSEALDSERVARNAYTWSFIPLTGFIFLFGYLLGIIVTLVLLAKLKRYAYITPVTADYQQRARRTLLATSLIVALFYVLVIILILALFALAW